MPVDLGSVIPSVAPFIAVIAGLFTIYNVVRAGWWRRKDQQAKQDDTKRPGKPWIVRVSNRLGVGKSALIALLLLFPLAAAMVALALPGAIGGPAPATSGSALPGENTNSSGSSPSLPPARTAQDMLNQKAGPPRQKYTSANPPEVPQLNSIIDRWMEGSSGRGDEANLSFIGRAESIRTNSANAELGEELLVSAHVFNDANHATGVYITDLALRIETVEATPDIPLRIIWTSTVTGDVFSTVVVHTDAPAALRYVPHSLIVRKDPSDGARRIPDDKSFGVGGLVELGSLKPTGGLDREKALEVEFKVVVSPLT